MSVSTAEANNLWYGYPEAMWIETLRLVSRMRAPQEVQRKYETSKREMEQLIETFRVKGYWQAVSYLESLSRRLFTNIELWLRTGIIAPETISLLERVFRELGRWLKR